MSSSSPSDGEYLNVLESGDYEDPSELAEPSIRSAADQGGDVQIQLAVEKPVGRVAAQNLANTDNSRDAKLEEFNAAPALPSTRPPRRLARRTRIIPADATGQPQVGPCVKQHCGLIAGGRWNILVHGLWSPRY